MDIVTSEAWGPPEDQARWGNFYILKSFDLNPLSQGAYFNNSSKN